MTVLLYTCFLKVDSCEMVKGRREGEEEEEEGERETEGERERERENNSVC